MSTAIFSFDLSLYTFCILFLKWTPPTWTVVTSITVSGCIPIALVLAGPLAIQREGFEFWGDSGAWCWISKEYQLERFFYL